MKLLAQGCIFFAFCVLWQAYLIMDYTSLSKTIRTGATDQFITDWTITPGDHKITPIENIIFGIACPCISVFWIVDVILEIRKNEKNEKGN
jgi:hypothetical protein